MKKPSLILTVTLNPAIDKTVNVPRFSAGRDFRTNDIFLCAGGKGINVSRVVKRLGGQTLATGLLAGPAGEFLHQEMLHEKIPHDFLRVQGQTRTSLTIIDENEGRITRILEFGPWITRGDLGRLKSKLKELLKKCRCVIFSGRNAHGLPDDAYAGLIRLAERRGVLTVLDTSGPALQEGLKAGPSIIKPNLSEAEFVLERRLNSMSAIKSAVDAFHRRGISVVIISLGPRGAVFSDNGKKVWIVPPAIRSKNAVGCGDALIAGFMHSYLQGADFAEAGLTGVAASAANVLSINSGFVDKREVERLRSRIKQSSRDLFPS